MISIITPTHKKTKLWDVVVESVMQQTYKDFEWVVLDNSKEGFFEKEFERFKKEHPQYSDVFDNVKIYHEYYEGTHPVAFYKNRCVELTSCKPEEWVVTFDHDDLLARTALEDFVGCGDKWGDKIDYIFGYESAIWSDGTISVPMDLFNLPNCISTTLPNIKIGDNFYLNYKGIEMPEVTSIDITYAINQLMGSHPRVLRKRLLQTIPYRYNENDYYEDDTLQTAFALLFLNVGYVKRQTVIYVRYDDEDSYNESSYRRPDTAMKTHNDLQTGLACLYESVRILYPENKQKRNYFYYNKEDFKTSLDND